MDFIIEDLKFGDFGLVREFLVLKRVDLYCLNCGLVQYYMCLGIGLVYWMVLEVFICCYIEKVDIFFLGVLFNVIFV